MADQLFWVDAGHKKIEVARADGRHRKALISQGLDKPRAIVLNPKHGSVSMAPMLRLSSSLSFLSLLVGRMMYWTDWSDSDPCVCQAWMDGTHVLKLMHSAAQVRWPNGLAHDDQRDRLYVTDGYLHRISYIDLHDNSIHILVQDDYALPHPYAIAVFKVSMTTHRCHMLLVLCCSRLVLCRIICTGRTGEPTPSTWSTKTWGIRWRPSRMDSMIL